MKRLQKKEPEFKGEITAFLAMLFVLMLSLVGALLESVSIQKTKNYNRADTALALESTFAEYDRQMLEEYDLFVRSVDSDNTLTSRLYYYGADNMTHTITKREVLSDNGGNAFLEQAVHYAKNWLGIEDIPDETRYEFYSDTYLKEEELVYMDLEELLNKEESSLPEEGNPLLSVQNLKNKNLITLVSSNPEELSNRSIKIEQLPSHRELKKGNWGKQGTWDKTDKVFLTAYVTEHFGSLHDSKESRALCYEEEYLLGGYETDRENLEKVCEQILSIRMFANYGYLLTDSVKQAEVEAMALGLCSLIQAPGIAEVVKHALLLAWAYGESIVDVRVLLKGNQVATVKSAETWQLGLANLVKLGTSEEVVNEHDVVGGLTYQSYLRGLLLMENKEDVCMRSLDLIESNLHIRTDECVTKIEVDSKVTLRRGVKDSFSTMFQYQ